MAALASRPAAAPAATVPPQAASSTPPHQGGKSVAASGNSVSASSNTAAVRDESVNEAHTAPQKNSTIADSAALALAAQKAAWRQQKPHAQTHHMSTRTCVNLAAVTAAHTGSRGLSGDSGSSKEAAWHLSHTYSTAVECWTGAGHTARMSAAATAAAASASPTSPAAGTAAAAAALRAQLTTGCLCVNPIHASSRQKGSAGPAAGNCRHQATTPQPAKQVAASTSYAVLPAATPASSSTSGPGPELLGASCVLTAAKAAVVPARGRDSSSTGWRHVGSVGSSTAVQATKSGVGLAASVPVSATAAGLTLPAGLLLLLPVTGYVLLGCGLVAVGWMV